MNGFPVCVIILLSFCAYKFSFYLSNTMWRGKGGQHALKNYYLLGLLKEIWIISLILMDSIPILYRNKLSHSLVTCVGFHRWKAKDLGIQLGLLMQSLRPLALYHGWQPGKGCRTIPAWLGPVWQALYFCQLISFDPQPQIQGVINKILCWGIRYRKRLERKLISWPGHNKDKGNFCWQLDT